MTAKISWSYAKYTDYTFSYVGLEGVRTLSVLLALELHNFKMEAAMDTDEAGEVSLQPEETAVDTQNSCAYLKNAIRYSYAVAIRRV